MITNLKLPKFKSQIKRHTDHFGLSIEEEIRQAVNNNSAIESVSPEIYTPLKSGVLPEYDIRTDRQEIALEATEKFNKSNILHTDEAPETTEAEQPASNEQPKNE